VSDLLSGTNPDERRNQMAKKDSKQSKADLAKANTLLKAELGYALSVADDAAQTIGAAEFDLAHAPALAKSLRKTAMTALLSLKD
jgi:hypothetical protein